MLKHLGKFFALSAPRGIKTAAGARTDEVFGDEKVFLVFLNTSTSGRDPRSVAEKAGLM